MPATILIVEDGAELRELYQKILEMDGHALLVAPDGPEALRIAERLGPIDLLLTDLVMPDMGGQELARRLLAAHPKTKVLFISGHGEEIAATLDPATAVLRKPVDLDVLRAKIQELLASSRPAGRPRTAAS